MYGLTQIYTGCRCGETWDVAPYTDVDTVNDRVESFIYCKVCGGNNLKPLLSEEGVPCMHAVTEHEHLVLSGFYYDSCDDWEEDNFSEDELDEFYNTKDYDDVESTDYGTHGDGDLSF